MPGVIRVIWWIGLIGALVATLAILKEVSLVLRTLRDIHRLGEATREAARGIAANVAAISKLDALEAPVRGLGESTRSIATTAGSVEQKLDTLASQAPTRGG